MKKKVFLLGYVLEPGPTHEERETTGESFAVCWIPSTSLDAADRRARKDLRADGWKVLARDHGKAVTRAPDPADQPHFEDARAGTPVHVTHTSPRWAVCEVVAPVRHVQEVAVAHCLVAGTRLVPDADLYDPRFWSKARLKQAQKAARALIEEQGWHVARIWEARPVSHATIDPALQRFYDEAEADGACLVFAYGPSRTRARQEIVRRSM